MTARVCPRCQKPAAVKLAPRCLYCGTELPDTPPEAKPGEDPLVERLRTAFILLQRCRSEGELGAAAAFLAPDLLQQFLDEVDGDRRSSVKHVIDKVAVGAVVLGPESAGRRAARIDAVHAEYWQDTKSRMVLRGFRKAKPHRQVWQLAPDPQAHASATATSSDRCASCGASLGAKIELKCPYCGGAPQANRLGMRVVSIAIEDPGVIYEEWKQTVDARLQSHASEREDDPIWSFLQTVKSLLDD